MNEALNMNDLASLRERFPLPEQIVKLGDDEYVGKTLQKGPKSGQIWLLDDGERAEYALVLVPGECDDRAVVVTAMSNDVTLQTDDSVVITDTPMGMPMVIWPSLTTVVPVRLLKVPCGELSEQVVRHAIDDELEPMPGVEKGRLSLTERRVTAISEFRRRAVLFIRWHEMLEKLPALHQEDVVEEFSVADKRKLFDAVKELGHSAQEAAAVLNGSLELGGDERKRLIDAGLPDGLVNQGMSLPDDLLVEVEQPLWRRAADRIAEQEHADGRMELAKRAKAENFQLAARHGGDGRSRWAKVLHKVSESENSKE